MDKMDPLKRGLVVFAILAVLTAIEYFLGINHVPQILLWVVALVKLLFVVQFFMHISRLFGSDEGGHE